MHTHIHTHTHTLTSHKFSQLCDKKCMHVCVFVCYMCCVCVCVCVTCTMCVCVCVCVCVCESSEDKRHALTVFCPSSCPCGRQWASSEDPAPLPMDDTTQRCCSLTTIVAWFCLRPVNQSSPQSFTQIRYDTQDSVTPHPTLLSLYRE